MRTTDSFLMIASCCSDRTKPGDSEISSALCRFRGSAHCPDQGEAALRGINPCAELNADWHRLLEICALSGTLICDEDGLYDPRDYGDRMLLGMKGQISEAELHFLRSRMRGGDPA